MTILKIDQFTGMIPRLPDVRLPDGAATLAANCNFAHGELRSLSGPASKFSTTITPRALFTDDGLRFFAWDKPTRAYLSPTVDDTQGRVYFNTEGEGLRVALMSDAYTALNNPRPPAKSWVAGIARPMAKPTVELIPTMAWNQDLGAAPRITAIKKLAGAEIDRKVATITSTVSRWQSFKVSIGDFSTSDSGAAPTPVAPVSGWIVGPDSVVMYATSVPPDPESGLQPDYVLGGNFFGPGKWRVSKDGAFQRYPNSSYLGVTPIGLGISGLQYKGNLYDTPKKLFEAMQDGTATTAAPSTDAEKALTEATISFLFEVVGSDGTILYSTENVSFTEEGGVHSIAVGYEASEKTTVAYVTTFENDWGEESAPSDPVLVDVLPFQDVLVRQHYMHWPERRNLEGMNLYRTYGNAAEFIKANITPQFTKVLDSSGVLVFAIQDSTKTPNTTTTLITQEWDEPPTNLHSLTYAGNGFFAAAAGKDLRMSEPYRPHAWPYFMTFPHTIVGVIEVENGLLVTTTAQPYLVQGPHPEQMTQQALNAEQAGITSRSMTKVAGQAAYVSNDGLVTVAGGQASLESSQQLFTREDWRNAYRQFFRNMSLGALDGHVIGVIDPTYRANVSGSETCFMLRLDEAPGYSWLELETSPTGTAVSATTDTLYLLYQDGGFAEFGAGPLLELLWRSKVYEYPRPVFFGAGIARYRGSFTVTLEDVDSGEQYWIPLDFSNNNDSTFRLPVITPSKRWQVTIRGKGEFHSVEFGASFAELKNG